MSAEAAPPGGVDSTMPSVPVTLLAGYLGSGKTTLVNRLLSHTDRRLAVLVNDVGRINIDASLIARHNGDTIELTNGCVCCSVVDGLAEAFLNLSDSMARTPSDEPGFDQVVIELSGVAEPDRVRGWANSPGFHLDGVVTVVDAERFAALDTDRWVADTVQRQVTGADLLVLTKGPTGVAPVLRDRLRALAPAAPQLIDRSVFDADDRPTTIDADVLVALDPGAGSRAEPSPPSETRDGCQTPVAGSDAPATVSPPLRVHTSVVDRTFVDRGALADFLNGLVETASDSEPVVVRAKGTVALDADPTGAPAALVQLVGARISITEATGPVTGLVVIAVGAPTDS